MNEEQGSFDYKSKFKYEYNKDSSKIRYSAVDQVYSDTDDGCSIKKTLSLSLDKSSIIRNEIIEGCKEKPNEIKETSKTPNHWRSYQTTLSGIKLTNGL